MKPSLVVFIVPLIFGIALYYVNKLDTDREAEKNIVIKKAVVAMGLNKNNKPKNVKKIFVSGRQRLFCFIDYTNTYPGQKISFHWIRNNMKISESIRSLKPEYENMYASLDHNFTPGQYQVRVFVNKVEKKRVIFKVVDKLKKYSLTVHKTPRTATVRVLNIGPVYYDGIKLESGRYHIEVSKKWFATYKKWIDISDSDKRISVSLKPTKTKIDHELETLIRRHVASRKEYQQFLKRENKRSSDATSSTSRWLPADLYGVNRLRKTANKAYQSKDYKKAIKGYKQIIRKDKKDWWSHAALGDSYIETGKIDEGLKHIAIAFRTFQADFLCIIAYKAYAAKSDIPTALRWLDKALNSGYAVTVDVADELINMSQNDVRVRALLKKHRVKPLK